MADKGNDKEHIHIPANYHGTPPSQGPSAHHHDLNPQVSAHHDIEFDIPIKDRDKQSMYHAKKPATQYVLSRRGKGVRPD